MTDQLCSFLKLFNYVLKIKIKSQAYKQESRQDIRREMKHRAHRSAMALSR